MGSLGQRSLFLILVAIRALRKRLCLPENRTKRSSGAATMFPVGDSFAAVRL